MPNFPEISSMKFTGRLAVFVLALVIGGMIPSSLRAQFAAPPAVGGYGYYPGYYNVNANTGNLYGSAEMVNAQGKLMTTTQSAKMQQEQVKQEKLVTRQKSLEEWKWERDNLPNTEDERRRLQTQERARSRNDPPVTEINSGYSLNVLLKDLQSRGGGSMYSSPILLDPELLKRINLTPAGRETSIGLFATPATCNGRLPSAVPIHDWLRESIEALSKKAVEQAKRAV